MRPWRSSKNADGSVDIQFGSCDGKIPNCLVTMPGWNYTVGYTGLIARF